MTTSADATHLRLHSEAVDVVTAARVGSKQLFDPKNDRVGGVELAGVA